jgi:hypothetical protein
MTGRTPGEVLRESRRRDSLQKRQGARDTVDQMLRRGDLVTFTAVARASVSTLLTYAEGVREHIEQAIIRQAAQPAVRERCGQAASPASLRTDLERSRDQLTPTTGPQGSDLKKRVLTVAMPGGARLPSARVTTVMAKPRYGARYPPGRAEAHC